MGLFDKYTEYKANKKEEAADLERRNPDHLPNKMSVIIRIIVGAYLIYLSYQMRGALTTYTDWRKWLFLGFIILFVVFGIWAVVSGIKALMKREYFDPNSDDFSEEAKQEREKAIEEARKEREKFIQQSGDNKEDMLKRAADEFYGDEEPEDEEEAVKGSEEEPDENVSKA